MKRILTGFLFAAMLICTTHAGYASGPTSKAPPDTYNFQCGNMYEVTMEGVQTSVTPISSSINIDVLTSSVTLHNQGVSDVTMTIIRYDVDLYHNKQVPVCYISDPTYNKMIIDKDDGIVAFFPKIAGQQMLVFKTCELRH